MSYELFRTTTGPSEPAKQLRGDMSADSTQTYVRMAQQAANHAPSGGRGGPLARLRRWWPFGRRT